MFTFDDFLLENVNVTIFTITPELKEVLQNIENPIAKRIIANSATNKEKKITLIDIVYGDYTKWSFVNSPKVLQFFKEEDFTLNSNAIIDFKKSLQKKYKSETRIGRILNKLYPDEYNTVDIENFVNEYKKYFQTKFELVDIVKGKDINKWYDCKNYEVSYNEYGTELNSSCMSPTDRNDYMDFYAVNGDKVSMVILYSNEFKNKIRARAILWKPDKIDGKENTKGELFMDRIYYTNQDDKNLLQKYAEDNKWYYKKTNSGSIYADIYNPNGDVSKIIFEINNMKIAPNKKFPYMDTLAIFDPETISISNDDKGTSDKKVGMLSSTRGGIDGLIWVDKYKKFIHPTDLVNAFSFKNERGVDVMIPVLKKDAVFMDFYEQYYTKEYYDSQDKIKVKKPEDNGPDGMDYEIFKHDAEFCANDDQKYYKGHVKYSDFLDEFIPKNSAKWVEQMDSWMPITDLVHVITDFDVAWGDYNPYKVWYHMDDPRYPYFKYKGEYYLKGLEKEYPDYFDEKEKIEYPNEDS